MSVVIERQKPGMGLLWGAINDIPASGCKLGNGIAGPIGPDQWFDAAVADIW